MKILAILSVAAAVAVAAPAEASVVNFQVDTSGCFGSNCTPHSKSSTQLLDFTGVNNSKASTNASGVGTYSIDLGSFLLTSSPLNNYDTSFTLKVAFDAPTGTTPNVQNYFATVTGTIFLNVFGQVSVDFNNTPQNFAFNGGSFTLAVNDLTLAPIFGFPDREELTGSLVVSSAVPEASTWAMLMLGFAGVGFAGYRRKKTALRLA